MCDVGNIQRELMKPRPCVRNEENCGYNFRNDSDSNYSCSCIKRSSSNSSSRNSSSSSSDNTSNDDKPQQQL